MIGTYHLFKTLNDSAKKFHEAKKFAIIGLMISIFIYYVCFQVIGIEWFNMDKSPHWNYKDWAQYVIDFILPVLIYISIRTER
jgi:predicted small integral membrane protein